MKIKLKTRKVNKKVIGKNFRQVLSEEDYKIMLNLFTGGYLASTNIDLEKLYHLRRQIKDNILMMIPDNKPDFKRIIDELITLAELETK